MTAVHLTDDEREALHLAWHDGACPDGDACSHRMAHAQTQGAWAVVGGSVQRAVEQIIGARLLAAVGTCGIRTVRTFAIPGGHGQITASCVEARGHGPDHRDADGNTWTESVR